MSMYRMCNNQGWKVTFKVTSKLLLPFYNNNNVVVNRN